MSNLNRRLKKAEKALNVDKEKRIVEIVYFADRPIHPDEIQGNRTIHYISNNDICETIMKDNEK